MEKKYKEFLQFSWKDSPEWQSYYTNIFPIPPVNKIERYKKKFYKLKIDSDFDVNYEPPTGQSSNTNTSQQQSYNQYPSPAASTPSALLNLETMIMLLFAISLPFAYHSTKIAAFVYLMRTFRLCGKPQWNSQYGQMLFTYDGFHLALYSLLLLVDRFNYYLILPIGMKMIIDISDNLKVMNIPALKSFMQYTDLIVNKKQEIITCKGHVEVAIGFLMLIGIFFKINSFILPIAYWQLMKVKYIISPEVKYSWVLLNQYTEKVKKNPNIPQIVVMIIDKVQWAFSYMGKVEQPSQQQSGSGSGQEANSNSGGLGGCRVF